MKLLLSLLVLSFCSTTSSAQGPDKTIAQVYYHFFHIDDTTQRDNPYTEDMVMLVGKNASRYVSYDGILQQERLNKILEEEIKNNNTGNLNIKAGTIKKVTRDQYFYFANENRFYTLKSLLSSYLIAEPTYEIAWSITNDTMNIKGIHCQKATARFKGRNWIAWYATELPFASGPWKLHGLPGLIVNAHDDKNEVKFELEEFKPFKKSEATGEEESRKVPSQFSGFATMNNILVEDKIQLPASAVKTSPEEFAKLQEAMRKDPQGFINTQISGTTSGNVKFSAPTVVKTKENPDAPKPKLKVLNNPLELSEP